MKKNRKSPAICDEGQAKEKLNPFIRNLLISLVLLASTAILLSAWFIFRPDTKTNTYNLFSIETISELTTLECRYHNVAVRDNEGDWLGIGKQYVWMEYDVILKAGVDIDKVQIEEPTNDGVVKIYLPPAEIFSASDDKTTIFKPVCELGPFTTLTADDERRIISEGIEKLKNDTATKEVISQAYISAKKVLEQYVINVGKLMGENYTVEWLDSPKDAQVSTTTSTVA